MPPKAAVDEASLNPVAKVLLEVLGDNDTTMKIDGNKMATILGLSGPKNVGRKLDKLIEPYGYEYKAGRFVRKDGTGATTPAKTNGSSATPKNGTAAAANDSDETETNTPVKSPAKARKATKVTTPKAATTTPATPKTPKTPKAAKTPRAMPTSSTKKRKLEHGGEDNEEEKKTVTPLSKSKLEHDSDEEKEITKALLAEREDSEVDGDDIADDHDDDNVDGPEEGNSGCVTEESAAED